MASREIGQLYDEKLALWRDINRTIWLMQVDPEQFSETERNSYYNARISFMLQCVRFWDIDDSRRWRISEVTGKVSYLDGGEDDESGTDSVDQGGSTGAEDRESSGVRRDSD